MSVEQNPSIYRKEKKVRYIRWTFPPRWILYERLKSGTYTGIRTTRNPLLAIYWYIRY